MKVPTFQTTYNFLKYNENQPRDDHGRHLVKRSKHYTQAMRDAAEARGHTMRGGGFPIDNAADLARAKRAFGRAKNKAAARKWINHRAKQLGEAPLGGDVGKMLHPFARVEVMKSKSLKDGLVWGWASIIKDANGNVTDHQGDQITENALMKAAHDYMTDSRIGGALHIYTDESSKTPLKAGQVVESMVFTQDLQKAMGIELPHVGWLIGYKITDPVVKAAYEAGKLPAFSIGGAGVRVPANG